MRKYNIKKQLIKRFYETHAEFATSPFDHDGRVSERGIDLLNKFNFKNKKVLDIGCGHGHILNYCKQRGAKCLGIDISSKNIIIAKHNYPNLNFRCYDIEKDYTKIIGRFDYVICLEVIEHLITDKTFDILSNSLTKNGILILSCPNYLNTCGMIKLISEVFVGRNRWSPFMGWSLQANEKFTTVYGVKNKLMSKFKIIDFYTLNIARGVFPFLYIKENWKNNFLVAKIIKLLERIKYGPLKYMGSNIVFICEKK